MSKPIKELVSNATQSIHEVYAAIKAKVAEEDFIVFDPDTADEDDILEMPYSFFVDRHGYHISGYVQRVSAESYVHFSSGEDHGNVESLPIDEMPIDTAIIILQMMGED